MSFEPMGTQDQHKILIEWNSTQSEFPENLCLHQLFESHLISTPESVALIYKNQSLTYKNLDERSNQLAHFLNVQGVGVESLVGICTERSVEMVVGILGILKAGAAYVPIDPSYPKDRIQFMLDDTHVETLLTESHLIEQLPTIKANTVCLDTQWSEIATSPTCLVESKVTPENLCYVIYTSGSTGDPKGISLQHRGVVNNIYDLNTTFDIKNDAKIIALSALGFDMCVYEVLGTLAAGGTIIMPDQKGLKDPSHWATLVKKHGVTVWNSAPALLEMLVDYIEVHSEYQPAPIRVVIQGGDWEPVTLPDRLRAIAPEAKVVVLGGATEASIHSIVYLVDTVNPAWSSIPYGKPMKNQTAYILDEDLKPVPVGESGELHLGGVGLARGYFERPELTAEKFIPHPFIEGERIYKTGDLTRWMPDGNIELVGRIDFQVKIRGHRIELGEIIAKIQENDYVQQAIVIMREDELGDKRLVAYVVKDQVEILVGESATMESTIVTSLRDMLSSSLPEYMVPQDFVVLDKLPLTPNGKVDRRSLPEPDSSRKNLEESYVAPSNSLQEVFSGFWSDILDVSKIGINDSFFALGGHSLKAVQLMTQINEMFELEIQLHEVFEHNTIENLAQRVAEISKAQNIDVYELADMIVELNQLSEQEKLDLLED